MLQRQQENRCGNALSTTQIQGSLAVAFIGQVLQSHLSKLTYNRPRILFFMRNLDSIAKVD